MDRRVEPVCAPLERAAEGRVRRKGRHSEHDHPDHLEADALQAPEDLPAALALRGLHLLLPAFARRVALLAPEREEADEALPPGRLLRDLRLGQGRSAALAELVGRIVAGAALGADEVARLDDGLLFGDRLRGAPLDFLGRLLRRRSPRAERRRGSRCLGRGRGRRGCLGRDDRGGDRSRDHRRLLAEDHTLEPAYEALPPGELLGRGRGDHRRNHHGRGLGRPCHRHDQLPRLLGAPALLLLLGQTGRLGLLLLGGHDDGRDIGRRLPGGGRTRGRSRRSLGGNRHARLRGGRLRLPRRKPPRPAGPQAQRSPPPEPRGRRREGRRRPQAVGPAARREAAAGVWRAPSTCGRGATSSQAPAAEQPVPAWAALRPPAAARLRPAPRRRAPAAPRPPLPARHLRLLQQPRPSPPRAALPSTRAAHRRRRRSRSRPRSYGRTRCRRCSRSEITRFA